MKVGIMQPYFLPYIGYWQLMNAVDRYVIYDDVNFIKGGWIHRNRILLGGEAKYINVPMLGASSFKKINEIMVHHEIALENKNLRMLENAYGKAPYFQEIFPILERIIRNPEESLALYLADSIREIHDYLEMKSELVLSSDLKKDCSKRGQEKVLEICKLLQADTYYNAIGGQALYSFSDFKENGIMLKFLKTGEIKYQQFGDKFVPGLSIVDVLMFNSKEEVRKQLQNYTLLQEEE